MTMLEHAAMRVLTTLAVAVVSACVGTAPFRTPDGAIIAASVATMERITLGGVEQSVWIRGVDTTKPLLIILHGGPGASESALFRHFDSAFEQDFVVIYWEQRGTGRSYSENLSRRSMSIHRMLADLDELIDAMRLRFGTRPVVLVAHSWGTVLGTLYAYACPGKIALYVGTGQIVNKKDGDRQAKAFVLDQARRAGRTDVVAELEAMDAEHLDVDGLFRLTRRVEQFGGTFHGGLSTGKLLLAALSTDEAAILDLILFGRGNRFSHEALLEEFRAVDLRPIRALEVPVVLLLGRYDQVTPSALAAEYLEQLSAPMKRLVWFEQSAHNAPFEEPHRFVDEVRTAVAAALKYPATEKACRIGPPSLSQ